MNFLQRLSGPAHFLGICLVHFSQPLNRQVKTNKRSPRIKDEIIQVATVDFVSASDTEVSIRCDLWPNMSCPLPHGIQLRYIYLHFGH